MISRGLTAGLMALTVTGLCAAGAVSAAGNGKPSGTASLAAATSPAAPSDAAPSLHVSGNHLVNARGQRVVLHGVDRSGSEYACVGNNGSNGWDVFDGPTDQASVTAMKTWHINAVRVPLNEACWNGESYVNSAFSGTKYRKKIEGFVNLLNRNGLVVILDLHWTDGLYTASTCDPKLAARALCQKPMPDTAESVPFWRSVAATFKNNDSVIFDLFNEPFPDSGVNPNSTEPWHCWKYGGKCTGIPYSVAGMQSLVDTVRAAGAKNVIMLGGLAYSNDLTEWLKYEPKDPDHNLAASWHSYNFNTCNTQSCWSSQVAPVLKKVPLIAGEIGESGCADSYIDPLMKWLDARSGSYLAWAWNADFKCSAGPGLITSYNGTPTNYGKGYRAHLLSLR
jgi:endoglucanase